MECSVCHKEFGNGEYCQHCGIDKFTGLANPHGYEIPSRKETAPSIPEEIVDEPSMSPEPLYVSNVVVEKTMICWACGEIIPADSKYCPHCSTNLYVTCPKCGKEYSSQYPACNECGTNRVKFLEEQQRIEAWKRAEAKRKMKLNQQIQAQKRKEREEWEKTPEGKAELERRRIIREEKKKKKQELLEIQRKEEEERKKREEEKRKKIEKERQERLRREEEKRKLEEKLKKDASLLKKELCIKAYKKKRNRIIRNIFMFLLLGVLMFVLGVYLSERWRNFHDGAAEFVLGTILFLTFVFPAIALLNAIRLGALSKGMTENAKKEIEKYKNTHQDDPRIKYLELEIEDENTKLAREYMETFQKYNNK